MPSQYSGNLIVSLMDLVDRVFKRNGVIAQSVDAVVVKLGLFKINIGPEVIESWKRIEAEKQAAISRTGHPEKLRWVEQSRWGAMILRAVARKAGYAKSE